MADEITKFEQHRAQLSTSLTTVAESMRSAAALAETFANFIKDASFDDGDKKSKKRKGTAEGDDEKPSKRKRKAKDPNAPKRPPSSYIMFQNDIRKDLKEKNPQLSNPDLLALISQKWAEMSEDDKAVYTQAVAKAKEMYSKEKTAYDARSPEEVAAADAANEAAIAAKKSQPRARAPKGQAVATAATPATTAHATSPSAADSDEEESDSEEEEPPKKTTKAVAAPVEEDSDEEDSEAASSEEEAPKPPPSKTIKKPKVAPAPAPAPASSAKTSKKSKK